MQKTQHLVSASHPPMALSLLYFPWMSFLKIPSPVLQPHSPPPMKTVPSQSLYAAPSAPALRLLGTSRRIYFPLFLHCDPSPAPAWALISPFSRTWTHRWIHLAKLVRSLGPLLLLSFSTPQCQSPCMYSSRMAQIHVTRGGLTNLFSSTPIYEKWG